MAEGKSSRVFLISSLILGILATITAFVYLENTSAADQGRKIRILVAKSEIADGTRLDANRDLVEKEVPETLKDAPYFLLAINKASYNGQRVNRRIPSGMPLTAADLASLPEVQISGKEMRAISIPVDGYYAIAGVLQPDDWIKIAVIRPASRTTPARPGDPALASETEIITPDEVRILAIGGHRTRTRPPITAAEQYQPAGGVSSKQAITIEVTEEQARVILAKTIGNPVSILLCPRKGAPTPSGSSTTTP